MSMQRLYILMGGVFLYCLVSTVGAASDMAVFPITDFGAVGDGQTVNTTAIQKAIDACSRRGGGRVLVAEGEYVTGTLFLKDGVDLHVAGHAALLGSLEIKDYADDVHKTMYKNEKAMNPCLIFARNAHAISLTGSGIIDGRGYRRNFPNKEKKIWVRPMLLRLLNCTKIRMRDITLTNPAAWTSAWLYCRDIVVDGITIISRANGNGDGLDFDGCCDVRVSNCSFDTSDDSICLQTSQPEIPCQDVTITNCVFTSKWAGIRIGLLSRADLQRVTVSNCVFRDIQDAGLKIQMCEGAALRNMVFSNLMMSNVPRPIFMTFCQQRACVDAPAQVAPMKVMENFVFSHIQADLSMCDPNSAIVITGMDGFPIQNVRLMDIQLITGGGGTLDQGARRTVPEFTLETLGGWWPEYYLLGGPVPCHGLYIRHVKGITVSHSEIFPAKPDARPAIVCDDVEELVLADLKLRGHALAESAIRLQNVRSANLHDIWVTGPCQALTAVEGKKSQDIHLASDNIYSGLSAP